MKEKIKENNQQSNTSENKTGWQRHFTGKNILINGLIAFFPAILILAILTELGVIDTLRYISPLISSVIIFGIIFGPMYLIGEIREKIKKR